MVSETTDAAARVARELDGVESLEHVWSDRPQRDGLLARHANRELAVANADRVNHVEVAVSVRAGIRAERRALGHEWRKTPQHLRLLLPFRRDVHFRRACRGRHEIHRDRHPGYDEAMFADRRQRDAEA